MDKPILPLSKEEIADFEACTCSDEVGLRFWLEVGVTDGHSLSDNYPQEMIDRVQQEINDEFIGQHI